LIGDENKVFIALASIIWKLGFQSPFHFYHSDQKIRKRLLILISLPFISKISSATATRLFLFSFLFSHIFVSSDFDFTLPKTFVKGLLNFFF